MQLARRAGARGIATVRSSADVSIASDAGAHHVLRQGPDVPERVRTLAPTGVHHIVEVAFGANVGLDLELLAVGGSLATYATDVATPSLPFWPLLFKNVRVDFLGSDDFSATVKSDAASAINDALNGGWAGMPIAHRFGLDEIAAAHECLETRRPRGRVLVVP